jgi:hypothetical protein
MAASTARGATITIPIASSCVTHAQYAGTRETEKAMIVGVLIFMVVAVMLCQMFTPEH